MTFVGYYEFSFRGSDRIGLFLTSLQEEVYSVKFFQLLDQEESTVRLGEQHIKYLPIVILDKRQTFHVSFEECLNKKSVYIVNRRHFCGDGGCIAKFREGQEGIYGISKQFLPETMTVCDIEVRRLIILI